MNPILRNILVAIGGFLLGNASNFATTNLGTKLIPLPEGVDPMDMQSLVDNIDKLSIGNYAVVFAAHALGTFVAAFFICRFVTTGEKKFAMGVGILFLLLGITNAFMIPAPTWFIAVDLIFAYIPMALLGYLLAMNGRKAANL